MGWRRQHAGAARDRHRDPEARQPLELPAVVHDDEEEPRPRLSVLRILVALALVAGVCFGALTGVRAKLAASTTPLSSFFAPYVDVTLTPTYQFQNPADNPARTTVLGFVVAASPTSCDPSWGSYYSLSQANERIALNARIAQLRSYGASVEVSFGGQANTSLDVACPSATALASAYESVISTYHLSAIDLDIEGPALDNFAAEQRRAEAIRMVQSTAAAEHRSLQVWLTLPVEPDGLQDNALSVIGAMLRDRVHLAGINIMAMDFTNPPAAGTSMLDQVRASLAATESQLAHLLPRYGIRLSPAAVWRHLGVTVMIGQNNIAGEQFTTADARGLVAYVRARGVARVSMWSLNRDTPCPSSFGPELSNTCSGTPQSNLEFSDIFGQLHTLSPLSGPVPAVLRPVAPDTNPANAPFPLWNPAAAYPAGYKVVENGEIYQAKWYNSAQDPGVQYQYAWQSPWELLGPVLPSDHAPVIPAPPPGTYPTWSARTVYVAGQRVLYGGLAYVAKWSSQGVAPGFDASQQPSSPWEPLYQIPGEPAPSL
jgi:chitinase